MIVYLDNSATTLQSKNVTKEMLRIIENVYGNPSSLHRLGVEAEKELRIARNVFCKMLNISENEICFTSGGTESDNFAIFMGAKALKRQGNRIITTMIEHPAVLECFKRLEEEGFETIYLPVDNKGFVKVEDVKKALNEKTILVSIMHVNNETGAIEPIEEIGKVVAEASSHFSHKILFHCDAVQSFGKIRLDVKSSHIHFLSASGHKIHGPRGIGFLYLSKDLHIKPLICGGGQERGLRSGTENLPAILGFAAAAKEADIHMEENRKNVAKMRDFLLSGICEKIPDILVNSPVDVPGGCLPHILNVSFVGTRGEVLLHILEQAGIFVSTGSACSSKKKGGSHVLEAMGLPPFGVEGALRFSLSADNTMEEMKYTLEKLKAAVEENRKILNIAGGRSK